MDNPVGSLTKFQKSVILGSILGDGYVRQFPGRKNALLEINHSYTQKEYVDWKYSILRNVVLSEPKMRKTNGKRIAYRFYTQQLPELTNLIESFYPNGKKVIPKSLELDSIALSVWFMDDGSCCSDSDYYLNTQQYLIQDQKILLKGLKGLGLDANLNRDKEYQRIRFLKSSIPKLKELITKNIIDSMRYKIRL
ncbi:hypothetical protein M1295_01745 [Patescibacteria group bacterium]|nr:hypothetical protein [Patescibacteria group bacterium]